MADPIAAAFRRGWKLQVARVKKGATLDLIQVMIVQEAWRRLTVRSRRALLAIAEKSGAHVHHSTRACLITHGLITDKNRLTWSGRLVVRHRPVATSTPNRIAGRPVIDVHLPEPAEVNP